MNQAQPEPNDPDLRTDVLIVGAGPVGLTVANFLGLYGVSAVVIERGDALIDYPRGVGMDDECLRVFQAIGLVDEVRTHTTPDQWLRFLTARGRCFASVEPRTREFGWPRRNAFIQPLVDRVLYEGLRRFPNIALHFGHSLETFHETGHGVIAELRDAAGAPRTVAAQFIVGADGGRSTVRKILGIRFEGETESTRWVVIDLRNDPIGVPDAYLRCIPSRPYVSMALPHGVRRVEFMVLGDETEEQLCSPEGARKLLRAVMPHPEQADIIRGRVYTHHARLAGQFRKGRALLAGDAAHLMPVWQGQGYNSGIRDANNIAWKLALIHRGLADAALLETYDVERREHAAAMIQLSVIAGRIFSPTNRWLAALRDALTLLLNMIPSVKNYFLQMRFKPMPRYAAGAVVHDKTGGRIAASSPVGRLFIQPDVRVASGATVKLDDALGPWFAVVAWAVDPARHMSAATREFWMRLGARFVTVMPSVQMSADEAVKTSDTTLVLGDSGALKEWFGGQKLAFVILRPDRFVAAGGGSAQMIDDVTLRFGAVLRAGPATEAPAKAILAAA
jgi:3-(3-hydroxy-phenyl)propionate hydroxylase